MVLMPGLSVKGLPDRAWETRQRVPECTTHGIFGASHQSAAPRAAASSGTLSPSAPGGLCELARRGATYWPCHQERPSRATTVMSLRTLRRVTRGGAGRGGSAPTAVAHCEIQPAALWLHSAEPFGRR